MSTTLKKLAGNIRKTYSELENWRSVGDIYGITCGLAFRIAIQGYDPKSPVIRARLGLPSMVPVSACPKCGGVHVKLRCDAGRVVRRELVEPLVGVIL